MVRRLPCVGFLGIQALAVSLGLRLVWIVLDAFSFPCGRLLVSPVPRPLYLAQKRKCAPLRARPSAGFRAPEAIVSAILRRRQPNRYFGRTPSADKMRMKA